MPTRKRSSSGSATLSKRRRTTTTLYRMPRIEWKEFIGSNLTPVPAGTASAPGFTYINMLNVINQGTGAAQRVGNRIRVKKIEVIGSFGDDVPLPLFASLVNFRAQASAPTTSDQLGPFTRKDNCDLWQYAIKDNVMAQTFRFTKSFGGYGRLAVFDRDTGTIAGDFNPHLLISNPNSTVTANTLSYVRITYSDI